MTRARKREPPPSPPDIVRKILAVNRMTTDELKEELRRLTGQESRTFNRAYLVRRVAFLIQAQARRGDDASGASDALNPPGPSPLRIRDRRLPPPGAEITKTYKGERLVVRVLEDGFEFMGLRFDSMTAIAKAVSGQKSINGFLFFQLTARRRKA